MFDAGVCYDAYSGGELPSNQLATTAGQNTGQFDGNSMLTFNEGVNPRSHTFVISFSVKTTASDAIVLVSSHSSLDDHIIVEIVNGKLRFNYGTGSDCKARGSGNRNTACDNAVTVEVGFEAL